MQNHLYYLRMLVFFCFVFLQIDVSFQNVTLSCWVQLPFRLRGMFVSIFALTIVMLEVMRQILASPSCIITAARSACCVGSQAVSTNKHTHMTMGQLSLSVNLSKENHRT